MMKQFLVISALVACLGLVLAAPIDEENVIEGEGKSMLALIPDDDANTQKMEAQQSLFIPFCQEARELVIGKIRSASDQLKSNAFNVLFSVGEEFATDTLGSGNAAAKKLAEQLRDPTKPVAEGDSADEIQQIIDEGARKIAERQTSSDLLTSAITVIKVMAARGKQVASSLYQQVRGVIQPSSIMRLNEACDILKTDYLDAAESLFRSHYETLSQAAQSENSAEVKTFLRYVNRMDSLDCGITKRLGHAKSICGFFSAMSPVVKNMLTSYV